MVSACYNVSILEIKPQFGGSSAGPFLHFLAIS